jgi:hypothetical protein
LLEIQSEVFALADSGTLDGLRQALQYAIQLEHATMPPYLFARYSLGANNGPLIQTLREIYIEEMHHMLIAGNLLKAIGGSPIINTPSFIPSFPTALPGTVASGLVVPLAPCSRSVIQNVFMRIEQPQETLEFPVLAMKATELPAKTIGEFYGRIRKVFEAGGDDLIVDKTGERQVEVFSFNGLQKITSAAQALSAIDLIVQQGEGTSTQPTFSIGGTYPANDGLAHYYRFAEIVLGKLKSNPSATPTSPPESRYFYDAADPIAFDESKVLPVRSNPKRDDFATGSPAQIAIDDFNYVYTTVLRQLHAAFNESPLEIYNAVESMYRLGGLAGRIVAIELNDGTRPGPTFEYAA